MKVDERIGVLVVHGIGEQRRFQHLEAEVRNLASAIADVVGEAGRVTVAVTPGASSALHAERESWCSERRPPVQVLVRSPVDGQEKVTAIGFHEVWCADLDEPATVGAQLRFWFWGLSMWALARRIKGDPDGFRQMRLPGVASRAKGIGGRLWLRARLLLVSTVFATSVGSVSLLNFLLRRFGLPRLPGSRGFIDYVGDVKLYGQNRRADGGPLYDLGQPPRVAIRRRMVAGLVDVATAGYDRWYVLAHSLGSVIAFNGLMETGHSLPNYVDRHRWCRLLACRMAGAARVDAAGAPVDWPEGADRPSTSRMMPQRPIWLEDDHVIYRDRLFARLRGLLTYGSPLDKFAAIWPALAPVNQLEAVFEPECEWVNVYDPTDPVGAHLGSFAPDPEPKGGRTPLRITNYAYRASPWLLVSHIRYMSYRRGTAGRMIHAVARWITEGARFADCAVGGERWLQPASARCAARATWRIAQWHLVAVFTTIATALVLSFTPVLSWMEQTVRLSARIAGTAAVALLRPIDNIVPSGMMPDLPLADWATRLGTGVLRPAEGALAAMVRLASEITTTGLQLLAPLAEPMAPLIELLPEPARELGARLAEPGFWQAVPYVFLFGALACLALGALDWLLRPALRVCRRRSDGRLERALTSAGEEPISAPVRLEADRTCPRPPTPICKRETHGNARSRSGTGDERAPEPAAV